MPWKPEDFETKKNKNQWSAKDFEVNIFKESKKVKTQNYLPPVTESNKASLLGISPNIITDYNREILSKEIPKALELNVSNNLSGNSVQQNNSYGAKPYQGNEEYYKEVKANQKDIKNPFDLAYEQAKWETYDPKSPYSKDFVPSWIDLPMRTIGNIPLNFAPTKRVLQAADEALGFQPVDYKGNPVEKASTGLGIADKALDLAGSLGGYAMVGDGGGANALNFTDNIANYAAGKTAAVLGKAPKVLQSIVPSFVRGAVDSGVSTAVEDIGKGEDLKTIAKDTAINTALGGGLFAAGKGLYDSFGAMFKANNATIPDVVTKGTVEPLQGTFKQKNIPLENAMKEWEDFSKYAQNKYGHYQLTDDEILQASIDYGVDPFKLIDNMEQISRKIDFSNVPDVTNLAERNRMAKIAGVELNIPKLQKPLEVKVPIEESNLTSKSINTLNPGTSIPVNSKVEYTDISNSNKNTGIVIGYKKNPINNKPMAEIQRLDANGNPLILNGKAILDVISRSDDMKLIDNKPVRNLLKKVNNSNKLGDTEQVFNSFQQPMKSIDKDIDFDKVYNNVDSNTQPNLKGSRLSTEEIDSLITNSDKWKDKGGLLGSFKLMRETWDRNIIDIAGKEDGKKIKEAIFDPIHKNEADRIRFMNNERAKIKALNLTSKESEAVQKFGEGKYFEDGGKDILSGKPIKIEHTYQLDDLKKDFPNSWQKIINATNIFRDFYSKVYPLVNESLERNGYKSIGKIENYFPHFSKDNPILKALGINLDVEDLPTDINGLTHQFKPGKNWVGNLLKRTGNTTDFGAVEGFDRYIEGVSKIIHHTDDIKNLREFNKSLRAKYSTAEIQSQIENIINNNDLDQDTKDVAINELLGRGKTKLSNAVADLEEYTNVLAGKKDLADRAAERLMTRKIYNLSSTVMQRVAKNMVAVNPASWLTNFIPLTQSLATTGKKEFIQAMDDTLKTIFKNDDFVNKSVFLTNRKGSEILTKGITDRAGDVLTAPMKWIDSFTSNVVTRSKYLEGIKKGLSESQAIKQADEWAAKMIGDRSLGAQPTLFNMKNPLTRLVTQFQLEVNNQMSFLMKDIPAEYTKSGKGIKSAAKVSAALGQVALYGYLYNMLYEKLVGRKPALDPISTVLDLKSDLNNPKLNNNDTAINLFDSATNQLPFASTFLGGGRIPISQAFPNVRGIIDGSAKTESELSKPLYYLLPPFGGGQAKKTIEAAKAIEGGGVYTGSGAQLKFPVDDSLKAILFGTSSLPEAQNYYDNKLSPLSKKRTEDYKALIKGISPKDAFGKIQEGIEVDNKKDELYKYIDTTKLTENQKKSLKTKIGTHISTLKKQKTNDMDMIAEIERLKEYYKNLIEK